jgi:hypothetical protein
MATATAVQTRFRETISENACLGTSSLSPKGIATITIIPHCGVDGAEPIPFTISCEDLSAAITVDRQATETEIASQCVGSKEMILEDYTVKLTFTLRWNRWVQNSQLLESTYGISAGSETVDGVTYDVRGVSVSSLNKAPRYFYVEIKPAESLGIAYQQVFPACQLAQAISGSTSFGKTDERTITLSLTAVVPPESSRVVGNAKSSMIEYTYIPQAA